MNGKKSNQKVTTQAEGLNLFFLADTLGRKTPRTSAREITKKRGRERERERDRKEDVVGVGGGRVLVTSLYRLGRAGSFRLQLSPKKNGKRRKRERGGDGSDEQKNSSSSAGRLSSSSSSSFSSFCFSDSSFFLPSVGLWRTGGRRRHAAWTPAAAHNTDGR